MKLQEPMRRSISGVRGTLDQLTPDVVADHVQGFATYLRQISQTNRIVVGCDTRPTSLILVDIAIDALRSGGWDVIELGIVPTPTCQIAIALFEAAGGVVITASHNPVAYNGLKFLQNLDGHGMFLRPEQLKEVFALCDSRSFDQRRHGERWHVRDLADSFVAPPYTEEYLSRTRSPLSLDNARILDYHLHRVISAMGKDLDVIRARNFSVAMDCCGGAGSPIDYVLLDYLYARVKRVNEEPGVFTRDIEPTPANLNQLCDELGRDAVGYDVGFATDCDNDRCVLIARDGRDNRYKPLEEDYTFAIAVDQVLGGLEPGRTVVTNWSTSQMIKDLCSMHHANLRRVPTGEVYTACDALHFHAAIAGEGSCAGVIDPRVGMGRDTLVVLWHVLAALAYKQKPLMDLVGTYPAYAKLNRNHRTTLTPQDMSGLIEKLQAFYGLKSDLAYMSREDGLIVALQDHSRIQIRASNTEPLLRVRTSARDATRARVMADEAESMIQQCAGKTE